jgi:hypothetical protein
VNLKLPLFLLGPRRVEGGLGWCSGGVLFLLLLPSFLPRASMLGRGNGTVGAHAKLVCGDGKLRRQKSALFSSGPHTDRIQVLT